MSPVINHSLLKAAQSKAVIARYLGNAQMWLQANEQMKSAVGCRGTANHEHCKYLVRRCLCPPYAGHVETAE